MRVEFCGLLIVVLACLGSGVASACSDQLDPGAKQFEVLRSLQGDKIEIQPPKEQNMRADVIGNIHDWEKFINRMITYHTSVEPLLDEQWLAAFISHCIVWKGSYRVIRINHNMGRFMAPKLTDGSFIWYSQRD